MGAKTSTVIHGSVQAFEPSFRDGSFQPWNEAYGLFVPSDSPIDGPFGAYLEVFEGEWFSVAVEAGGGGPIQFLDYRKAFMRALGTGSYSGSAYVHICTPTEDRIITAVDAEGNEVPVFSQTQYLQRRVASRLVFPHR